MSDTIIWITGATEGIGLALAQNQPFAGARIINLSRKRHPDYESVQFDLTDPSTWNDVRRHLEKELSAFKGKRAIFIQNGYWPDSHGVIDKVDSQTYQKGLYANVMAPLALGEMFVKACRPGYESGLVMMSAGAAACCLEGLSIYAPGKIAIEHWAQVVDTELNRAPGKPWVVAVRPGGVLTKTVRRMMEEKADPSMPNQAHIRNNAMRRQSPDGAARHIWAALPPAPGTSLISFGLLPEGPEYKQYEFEGARMKLVNVPGWQLMYR
jgi:NAD(P)-dependent dehydrogenase (short-subunit alcohol dehydrogenase family)